MKRRIVLLLTAIVTAGMLSACGNKETGTEETQTTETTQQTEETGEESTASQDTADAGNTEAIVLKDFDVDSFVTLNEYNGMSVSLQKPAVDDAQVDAYIKNILKNSGGQENLAVMDRAVEKGDTVNINYVGTLDGEAFEGGTDDSESGTNLEIGSNSFIAGFEDGLIGATPGTTVELNLTFPENYTNAELAGKETVFTVNVNGIAPAELTEEMVPLLNEELSTIEEYRQFVYDTLMEEAQLEFDNNYDANVEDALIQKLIEECSYTEVPESLKEKYSTNILNNMTTTASMYGLDLETYALYAYGMSYADFELMMQTWAEMSAQQALAFQAIANKENMNITDEKLEEELQNYATQYGYESADEFLAGRSKEEYREYLMFNDVLTFLTESAKVTVEE